MGEGIRIYKGANIHARHDTDRGMSKQQRFEVARIEKGIRNNANESLYAVNSDGTVVYQKEGEDNRVNIPDSELAKLKDSVITHNHPNGNSFSLGDLKEATKADLRELRAVSGNRIFSIRRPKGGWNVSGKDLNSVYSNIFSNTISNDSNYQRMGDLQYTRSMITMQHRMIKQLARQMGWQYTYRKVK